MVLVGKKPFLPQSKEVFLLKSSWDFANVLMSSLFYHTVPLSLLLLYFLLFYYLHYAFFGDLSCSSSAQVFLLLLCHSLGVIVSVIWIFYKKSEFQPKHFTYSHDCLSQVTRSTCVPSQRLVSFFHPKCVLVWWASTKYTYHLYHLGLKNLRVNA